MGTRARDSAGDHRGGLQRSLGRWDVFVLAFGAMIGWGWVVLAGTWILGAGVLGAGAAFALGGLAVAIIGLTYAELAAALPFVGGEHVYVQRAFGRGPAFVAAWAILFGYVSVVAFEAIALPVAVATLVPEFRQFPLWSVADYRVHGTEILLGSGAALLMTLINIRGIQFAARVQALAVLVVLAAGAVLILGGFLGARAPLEDLTLWTGWGGILGVVIMVPFLFVGFDVIPQSAEEIGAPARDIGRMLMVSVFAAALFYAALAVAVGFAGPLGANAAGGLSGLATADAAARLWGAPWLGPFVVLAGIAGILSSWNAFLIGASRALFVLAEAGELPRGLAALHGRYGTPWAAIALIGGLSILAPLLGRPALVWIVDAGGLGIVIAYGCVAAAFLALRRREPDLPRPYKAPFGTALGTLALALSLGLAVLYLPGSPAALVWPEEWALVAGWSTLGALLWAARAR